MRQILPLPVKKMHTKTPSEVSLGEMTRPIRS